MNALNARGADSVTRNKFWREVTSRLDASFADHGATMSPSAGGEPMWAADCPRDVCVTAVPLQCPSFAIDVSEHGLMLFPTDMRGRFALAIGFRLESQGTVLHSLDDGDSAICLPRRLEVRPGSVTVVARSDDGLTLRVRTSLLPGDDAVGIEATVEGAAEYALDPYLWWHPRVHETADPASAVSWLVPQSFERGEALVTRSNSSLPDPDRPSGLKDAGVALTVVGADRWCAPAAGGNRTRAPRWIGTRRAEADARLLQLPGWSGSGSAHAGVHRLALAVAPNLEQGRVAIAAASERTAPDRSLVATLSDPDVTRQVAFSVHNSLMSKAYTDEGLTISLHGRRDRGMGDVAHLHQSYQMHLVALAAGQGRRVSEELRAFAMLQDGDGAIRNAPRPGKGTHPYVPGYTDAHLILGAHRYVSWTGDIALLNQPIRGRDGLESTMLGRLERSMDYLTSSATDGLMRPCGWLDAWPSHVRAQAQISMMSALAFDSLGDLIELAGLPGSHSRADECRSRAATTRARVTDRFLDDATGLYAEHDFGDRVEGGSPDDFWAHTQISGVLSAITTDPRGLEHVRSKCLSLGVSNAPVTTFDSAYVRDSTDASHALDIDSTATWMLACWPELTHQYALAAIMLGRPDDALDAVQRQLPGHLHARNPRVAPFYYAEKYLFPGDRPWLFTWGGDPSLVEVVLTGFLGVTAGLDGMTVRPCLPTPWRSQPQRAAFMWRNEAWLLVIDPALAAGSVVADGVAVSDGLIQATGCDGPHTILVGAGT